MFGRQPLLLTIGLLSVAASGCALVPEIRHEPQYHNPFPQLHSIAVLPFFNLSADPTVNQDEVAEAYFHELQKIPGFQVMPPGVARQLLAAHQIDINEATDFQALARQLGVDAIVRGAVTEFSPYYPPKMGVTVDWFAANPSFHPVPPGYGLPWGTSKEEFIPSRFLFDAEFALAREQLETQTPPEENREAGRVRRAADESASADPGELPGGPELPAEWPDPRGFIPVPPQPMRPAPLPQSEPVMTHTRIYDAGDIRFTERLADYFYFRDDARGGGWQSYLQRTDDFVRFCCHLHIVDMLASRGGAGQSRVVWRWPIDRYER